MSDPDTAAAVGPADGGPARRGNLARADKVMSATEVDDFLRTAFCARIATVDADGYPYILPNLFTWLDAQVYLHTARRPGHFLANIRHANRTCVEVDAPGEIFPYGHIECDTSVSYASVVLFGRIRIIASEDEQRRFFTAFMGKYAPPDSWGREQGSFPRMGSTIVYAVTPDVITGKRGALPAIGDQWPARNLTASPNWIARTPSAID
jgi:nitroimidazol reductase NimA-like FMN-containing flavoprotein (pyridoxamine 5'-phosphate oxidase superfamily)